MTLPNADQVAGRALQSVGTPFRLYGRKIGVALDCAGVVSHALDLRDPWFNYGLKGDYLDLMTSIANQIGLLQAEAGCREGDIVVADCGARQLHLLVRAQSGWVHAHAGLRRVVHTPGISPWPLIAAWRSSGV